MLWKWLISLTLVTAILAVQAPAVPSNLKIRHDDILKVLPQQQDKLKELVEKLANAGYAKQVAIVNDYADDLLLNLNNFLVSIAVDPVPMPDIVEEFEWRIWPITYHGVMSLTDGWLQGLATYTRKGDVTVQYQYPNIKIHLPLSFDVLMFDYNYKAQFMNLGPTGNVDGKVTGCTWTMDLDLNMITLRASLEKYKLNTLGNISLKFHGNALVDWMINIFVSVTIPFVQPIIKIIVEGFINGGMDLLLNVYNQMICTLLADCPADDSFSVTNYV